MFKKKSEKYFFYKFLIINMLNMDIEQTLLIISQVL